MTFSAVVTSVTKETILPKVFDQTLNGNVGIMRFFGNALMWRSGFRLDVPIKTSKNTLGGTVGVADKLSTERQNTRNKMQFNPKMITKPVVIADIESTLNKGDERVLELIAVESESVAMDLLDDFADQLYTGTGTGNSFDSLLNAADDGTNYTSYGSLSLRTGAGVLDGYLATSVGTLALSDMSTAYNSVKVGGKRPTIALCNETVWTAYEGLLQPTVRAGYQINGLPQVTRTSTVTSANALRGEIGFDSLYYRGTPLVADEKSPAQKMWWINEDHFKFYAVNIAEEGYEQLQLTQNTIDSPVQGPLGRGFNFRIFMAPVDQLAKVAHVVVAGNFVSTMPRTLGQLQGITG
ncbi:phage major capsid protein [Candidatus Woesearchaeota archaeon]|nr:phage major capsid protein [Candidatus Woesearchaeota archaeon]